MIAIPMFSLFLGSTSPSLVCSEEESEMLSYRECY